jgi:hypothetical protein
MANLFSFSRNLSILHILHNCNHIIFVLLCLVQFNQHNVFNTHLCCNMYQSLFLFMAKNISLYINITLFSIHLFVNIWVVSTFGLLWIMIQWTFIHIHQFECHFQLFWIYMLRNGIVRLYDNFMFNFWGTSKLFSIAAPFYIPTRKVQPNTHFLFFSLIYICFSWRSENSSLEMVDTIWDDLCIRKQCLCDVIFRVSYSLHIIFIHELLISIIWTCYT